MWRHGKPGQPAGSCPGGAASPGCAAVLGFRLTRWAKRVHDARGGGGRSPPMLEPMASSVTGTASARALYFRSTRVPPT